MKIAILTGGTGLERDVALKSAQTFRENISVPYDYYILPEEMDNFFANYKNYDLVIPVFHGKYGEDGVVFGLLESLGVKYVFSSFKTHTICMDKFKTNILVEKIGVKIPLSFIINNISQISEVNANFPLIVKPNSGGSSVATYKVNNFLELEKAIKNIFEITGDLAIVQEFIVGSEYSVPVIGNDNLEVLPIMKVNLISGDFFDYEEKYNSDGSNEVFDEVDENLKNELEIISKKIYIFLECAGISRIDFIVNASGIYFLEVNTIPGFSTASIFPKAWKLTGRTLPQIVDKIIELGFSNKYFK